MFKPRKLLFTLSEKRLSELGLSGGKCDDGTVRCSDLPVECCTPIVNVFLDDYNRHFSL